MQEMNIEIFIRIHIKDPVFYVGEGVAENGKMCTSRFYVIKWCAE
jgi:hypothetical protein